jgi:hypothetical protein
MLSGVPLLEGGGSVERVTLDVRRLFGGVPLLKSVPLLEVIEGVALDVGAFLLLLDCVALVLVRH